MGKEMKRVITVFGLLAFAAPALSETLRCDINVKQYCTASEGCRLIPPKVFNRIDMSQQTYQRCDSAGCDTHKVILARSGIYLNIVFPGGSTIAKMVADGSEFLEVATQLTNVYLSFGACQPDT